MVGKPPKKDDEVLCYIHNDYVPRSNAILVGESGGEELWMCDACQDDAKTDNRSDNGAFPEDTKFWFPRDAW